MHNFFALENLRAQQVNPCQPWVWTQQRPAFSTKEEFREWCSDNATQWCFYSAVEGTNANVRISRQNPPMRLHGIVADYDAALSVQDIQSLIAKNAVVAPMYYSQTFSGGARLVWVFDEPVFIDNHKLCEQLLKIAGKELKLKSLLPSFDPASLETSQYFEAGSGWTQVIGAAPIDPSMVGYWMHEACKKTDVTSEGPAIPLDVVYDEVQKQFPSRWQGNFELGCRGPLFWINDGIDRVGCEVAPTGMICYSSRAGTSFAPWGVILGNAFVKAYETKKYGTIVDQYWYDGACYWWKTPEEEWRSSSKEDLVLHLKVGSKLSTKIKDRETSSEVDRVLYSIQMTKKVDAAVPFIYNPNTVVQHNGLRHLNINKREVMQPVESDHILEWGEGFPWLAEYFDNMFDPPEQKLYLMAWLKRFYESALGGHLEAGHNLFIAGPPEKGKSFFSMQILRQMMGGSTDASAYLMSESAFNKELGEVAVWNVDDGTSSHDWKSKKRFSEMVKKSAANQFLNYQPKFKDAASLPWSGRVVVTLNDDAQSLDLLPDLNGTILDKLMLLRCSNWRPEFSVMREQNNSMVTRELPFFLRWLTQWTMPADIKSSARFGFEPFHHPELVAASRDQSPSYRFREALELWRVEYKKANPSQTYWEGKVTDLAQSIGMIDGLHEVRGWKSQHIARWLHQIQNHTPFIHEPRTLRGYTIWKIDLA